MPQLPVPPPRSVRLASLHTAAAVMIIAALGWFLLKELTPVVRPLLVSVLLAYVLMPYHSRLRNRLTAPVSLVLLASITVGLLIGLALAVQTSVNELTAEWPRFQPRVDAFAESVQDFGRMYAPSLVDESAEPIGNNISRLTTLVARPLLSAAASGFIEACIVGLYLLFLLLEAAQFPDRIRKAYAPDRAKEILDIAGQVNSAIVSYLMAKVRSSVVLAVPVGLILWFLGVKFALLWAVLTFLCNFVPYLGSVTAYVIPAGFAFLQLDPGWQPVTVAVLLLACHTASASVIEPMLLGHAVGLSPLVILISLAFWGLLWGIPGLLIAVPLTVVAVIVMNHFDFTRPVARLLSDA
jgi:AI-2 transport protein TqsA